MTFVPACLTIFFYYDITICTRWKVYIIKWRLMCKLFCGPSTLTCWPQLLITAIHGLPVDHQWSLRYIKKIWKNNKTCLKFYFAKTKRHFTANVLKWKNWIDSFPFCFISAVFDPDLVRSVRFFLITET